MDPINVLPRPRTEEEYRETWEVVDERVRSGPVYAVEHVPGEPCPVVDLLYLAFGPKLGEYLLWNKTCFPFDEATAWEQAKALIRDAAE